MYASLRLVFGYGGNDVLSRYIYTLTTNDLRRIFSLCIVFIYSDPVSCFPLGMRLTDHPFSFDFPMNEESTIITRNNGIPVLLDSSISYCPFLSRICCSCSCKLPKQSKGPRVWTHNAHHTQRAYTPHGIFLLLPTTTLL